MVGEMVLVDIHADEAHAATLALQSLKHLKLRWVEAEGGPPKVIPAVRCFPSMCVCAHKGQR